MRYKWMDYTKNDKETVESWLDSEAVKYTGCDDGWDQFVEYWINEPDMVLNGNFFVKVIMDGGMAVGAMAIFLEKEKAYIQEFIVSPERRGMGTGSSILREFLQDGEHIIGQQIEYAEACIFPSNLSSQRAFEKAGFRYSHAHPDGDAWYYEYRRGDLSGMVIAGRSSVEK